MHRRIDFRILALFVMVVTSASIGTLKAQTGSLSVFSPYTMYGIGDLLNASPIEFRAMGGVGVGFRNASTYNFLNPASLSATPQRSALFSFGVEAYNTYSKTTHTSTSYNGGNLSNLGLAFPLAKGVGLGFSLTPVSAIGYQTVFINDNPQIIEDIGRAVYTYKGEGGISKVSMDLGVSITRGLSLGGSIMYNFGTIDRYYNAELTSYLNPDTYRSVLSTNKTNISKVLYGLGLQYTFRVGKESGLTLGATYQFKGNMNTNENAQSMIALGDVLDTVKVASTPITIKMPAKIAAGIFFQSPKFTAGFDYQYQDWNGAYEIPKGEDVTLRAQEEYKFGISYTPNIMDVRSQMKRWTYKLGFRYGTSYMTKSGALLRDYALSLGFDVPLKRGSVSRLNVGAEFGTRGTTKYNLVKENYIRVFLGLKLFGEDMWFYKPKFN